MQKVRLSPLRRLRSGFPLFLTMAFVLCVALLVGEMYSFFANMRNLERSNAGITENMAVLREIVGFKAKFFEAEGGYRGYLISGNTVMLQPYHRLIDDHRPDLGRLSALVSLDQEQISRVALLNDLVDARLKSMADVIETRQKQGLEAAQAQANPGEGRRLTEEIEKTLGAMDAQARRQLDFRTSEASEISVYGLVFMLGSGVLGIIGLSVFYVLTRKYFFQQSATENALRLRQGEFRAIFDMAAVGIIECASDAGIIVRANSKLSALFGYSASELEQMSFFQLLHPATVTEDRAAFGRLLRAESPGPWVVERRCLKRDGQMVWVRASFGVIPKTDRTQISAVGLIEDIDDRKRIEQTMQDNAAILRAIAEDTRDLIWVKDVDGRLVMANPSLLDFLGKRRDEVVGHAEIDFLDDPTEAKRMREIDRRVMRDRTTEYVEEEITVGGKSRVVLSTKVPYMGQEGDVIGVVSISRDITERKQAEKELLHSRDQLASDVHERNQQLARLSRHLIHVSEEEKGKLARELHDELGSALAAISMDMGWVLNQVRPINGEIAERQERALQGVRATLDLKRRLVDGLRPLTLEHFGFEFALRGHCEGFAESAAISVEVLIPEVLPVIDAGTGLALFRMVQECLTNVAKHASATRVRVSVEEAGSTLLVRVEDDGIGLPEGVAQSPETYGLVSMRERIAAVGGTLAISHSLEFKGTMVEARVPTNGGDAGDAGDMADPVPKPAA